MKSESMYHGVTVVGTGRWQQWVESTMNPILEIVSWSQTMVWTVVHNMWTVHCLGSLVQSKIGPVWPVRDF